ncbi:hypothetical protein LCGC14_1783570 [marine sediment metagenome]|uniref:Uncharacterized protein n=1 Tax=marine sediment metagenome TaxID=412755 RepID=A0A0F9GUS7_9ZZZZ
MEFLSGVFAALLLWPIFIVGTLWFWTFSAVMFGWMIYLTEDDSHFFATVSLIAFVWLMSSANSLSVLINPLIWLKWIVVYLAIGSTWSFLKWFSYLHKTKDHLKELKERFLNRYDVQLTVDGKISEKDFPQFAEYLNDAHYMGMGRFNATKIRKRADVIPTVKGRFGDLTRWIIWWPMSAFWTILNDPLRRLAQALVRAFRGIYTKIALSVFSEEV